MFFTLMRLVNFTDVATVVKLMKEQGGWKEIGGWRVSFETSHYVLIIQLENATEVAKQIEELYQEDSTCKVVNMFYEKELVQRKARLSDGTPYQPTDPSIGCFVGAKTWHVMPPPKGRNFPVYACGVWVGHFKNEYEFYEYPTPDIFGNQYVKAPLFTRDHAMTLLMNPPAPYVVMQNVSTLEPVREAFDPLDPNVIPCAINDYTDGKTPERVLLTTKKGALKARWESSLLEDLPAKPVCFVSGLPLVETMLVVKTLRGNVLCHPRLHRLQGTNAKPVKTFLDGEAELVPSPWKLADFVPSPPVFIGQPQELFVRYLMHPEDFKQVPADYTVDDISIPSEKPILIRQ